MNVRALWASLLGTVILAVGGVALNLAFDNTPILGLDLRGGVSAILAPEEGASSEDLVVVRDLIRDSLESRGIAEPDVRVEGANIVVDLPGVNDQTEALEAVEIAGIVTLRPVFQCFDESLPADGETTTDSAPTTTTDGAISLAPPLTSVATVATLPGLTTSPDTVLEDAAPDSTGGTVSGFMRSAPTDTSTSATVTDDTITDDTAPADPTTATTLPPLTLPVDDPAQQQDNSGGQTVLQNREGGSCLVGPVGGTGEVFEPKSATATLDTQTGQGWGVGVDLRPEGQTVWNALALECNLGAPTCPSRQLAIVLDDVIQSAPVVNEPNFSTGVSISGRFTEDEVRSLASVLNRGAFPVDVTTERIETVSATAGNDSLNAAIIAGLIGVIVMLLFMVAYYRKLSVVIITGLVVWGMTAFSLASLVSQWTNYSLSLAGATGIIVAVGVTVDSYVVFFERLKDEVRNGRSLRNAAPRSFDATWRTIVAADLVSLLASAILFWLSVGSVKGFALYLGLTTICDLFVCYFYTRPAVFLLSRSGWLEGRSALGIGAPA